MLTTYSFESLVNNPNIRGKFMRDYSRLIRGLMKHGFTESAMKHARNKERIETEIALLDRIAA